MAYYRFVCVHVLYEYTSYFCISYFLLLLTLPILFYIYLLNTCNFGWLAVCICVRINKFSTRLLAVLGMVMVMCKIK